MSRHAVASTVASLGAALLGLAMPSPATARRASAPRAAGVTVALGGDVSFARGVDLRARRHGWNPLLRGVAPVLRRADYAIVNLESPLGRCLPGGTIRTPRLCGDPRSVVALRAAGVDAVTLANNHALDVGPAGLRRTAGLLRRGGITPLGLHAALTGQPRAEPLGRLVVVAVNLTRPALEPGRRVPIPSPAAVARVIRRARRAHPERPVLLLAHLGREYDPFPGPRERAYGRAAVTAGASAVVLNGAHMRRALVLDRGVPVHLGLGNLLFDQRDPRTHLGALLTLRLQGHHPARVLATRCVHSLRASLQRCPGPRRTGP